MQRLAALVIVVGCGTAPDPAAGPASARSSAARSISRVDAGCSAQPIDAKIARIEVRGVYQVVTVDKGADDGVCERWSGRLIGTRGAPYPFQLELVELRATTSLWRFGATIEDSPAGMRLSPP